MPVQATTCPICRAELNPRGECLGCLLRVGLGATDVPRVYGDFRVVCHEDGSPWELGRGAMGVTYRATDEVLHRTVALKVMETPEGMARSPAVRVRFLREARSAASLRHPNVAEIFQFGTSPENSHAYYAMELIDGETLAERVRRDGPLPVADALGIAVQIARALAAAADRGLVHRDLKPGNVMLTRDGSAGAVRVAVIDFGLAKAMAGSENAADLTDGGFVGTPAFASPEQFRGEPADARSDLYSLGVTLWFALTGQTPFAGKTLAELRDHPARAALPVRQLTGRKVPTPVVNLLRSLLALDPAARPASARELLAALEGYQRRPGHRALHILTAAALLTLAAVWWTHRRPAPLPAAATGKSVAVLPFDDFSTDKDSAFLADGVQDEVLADLSKLADLKVISRSSTMRYKEAGQRDVREIGRTLEVSHVLEGSVQRVGNRVRVTAQLIDARTDAHLWAEHYDRELTDVFAIQSEIAQAVAGQLRAIISPQEQAALEEVPTHDEQAYQLYLRARARLNVPDLTVGPEENARTIDLLRQATARDPGFARAFAMMAEVQARTYIQTLAPADGEAVRAYADEAARLRPGSTDANLALATYDYEVRRDYARAREEFAAVVRQSPNDARAYQYLALVERRQGRWQEAAEHSRRAMDLDPENELYFEMGTSLLSNLRFYPEVLTLVDRRLASHPAMVQLHATKAEVLLDWKADTRAARGEIALVPPGADRDDLRSLMLLGCDCFERDFDAAGRDLAAYKSEDFLGQPRAFMEGFLAHRRGDDKAAATAYAAAQALIEAEVRENPGNYASAGRMATLHACLGRKEAALEEGRRMLSLVPPGDTLDTPLARCTWAHVLVLTGETDEAISVLKSVCGQPFGPSYGDLRGDPDWDALRGDRRFEAMVASLAPERAVTRH